MYSFVGIKWSGIYHTFVEPFLSRLLRQGTPGMFSQMALCIAFRHFPNYIRFIVYQIQRYINVFGMGREHFYISEISEEEC